MQDCSTAKFDKLEAGEDRKHFKKDAVMGLLKPPMKVNERDMVDIAYTPQKNLS